MFFLEKNEAKTKSIKDAAGLGNSKGVMPFYTTVWRQIAVCEEAQPLKDYIGRLPEEKRRSYRIICNDGRRGGE